MRILTSLFGGAAAKNLTLAITNDGTQAEMPYREVAKLLWSYYLNNGLYDELRLAGYFLDEPNLKAIRNPAGRVVKFYADTVWPGRLPDALPLDVGENETLTEPLEDLWKWSNWQSKKQLLVRLMAVLGECYIKVAQPEGKQRVFLQLIRPEYVADDNVTVDEQGNITYIRVDVPRSERRADGKLEYYTHTEVWDKASGTARFWKQRKGINAAVGSLGTPLAEYDIAAEWGIDFVPFVRAVHMDIGEDRGVGAFLLHLDKIDEANRLATRLHQMLFRHNSPLWALRSNMVDSATGRPLPPPRLATTTNSDGEEVVNLDGEKFIRLPGNASLESLIPEINYSDHLAALNAHMAEMENDLPELRYFRLQDAPDMSGRAIRLMMQPAVLSAAEVRGNLEDALVRAQKMALTIGQNVGIWSGLGDYESGDLEHGFRERPILDGGRLEEAETWQAEVNAGLPLITTLKRSGWDEARLEELEADFARSQAMQQGGLAASLLGAMERLDAGQMGQSTAAPQPVAPAIANTSGQTNEAINENGQAAA